MEIMLNSPNFFSCPALTAASTRRRGWREWSWCRRWWDHTRGQSGAGRRNQPTTSTWGRLVRRGRHICHDLFHLHRPGSERPSSILSPRRRRNSTSPRHVAHIRYLSIINRTVFNWATCPFCEQCDELQLWSPQDVYNLFFLLDILLWLVKFSINFPIKSLIYKQRKRDFRISGSLQLNNLYKIIRVKLSHFHWNLFASFYFLWQQEVAL